MADQSVDPTSEKGKEILETPLGKKKRNRLFLIGIFFFMILALAGSVILFVPGLLPAQFDFLGRRGNPPEERKEATLKMEGHLYDLDPFIVNLADPGSSKYLKIRIGIESCEAKPDEEFQKRLPQLRDAILTILSSKTYKEIYDSEGKGKLKGEIIQKANQLPGRLKVKTIYFTEFVVQ